MYKLNILAFNFRDWHSSCKNFSHLSPLPYELSDLGKFMFTGNCCVLICHKRKPKESVALLGPVLAQGQCARVQERQQLVTSHEKYALLQKEEPDKSFSISLKMNHC